MTAVIRKGRTDDLPFVRDIFNHYVNESLAAFWTMPMDDERIRMMFEASRNWAFHVVDEDGSVLGFGMLKPWIPHDACRRTGECGYFLHPGATGRGFGTMLFESLLDRAVALRMDALVVKISSENTGSIRFHERFGFTECGRVRRAGRKFERDFDIILMQKFLDD